MRVFSHFQLAVFLLAAATAHADAGYAYATITGGSSPTVSAVQSLNSANGPITVSRSGTGTYVVTFANSGLGGSWTVLTSPVEAGAAYCPVENWGGSSVTINCYGSGGVAQDNSFNVLAVSKQNDKNIAFAWADQSSAASYTPNTGYAYNPSGSIGITRSSTGNYQVSFNGLSGVGGTVQITAYSSNAHCASSGWTSSSSVGVLCFSPTGTPVDSRYTIAVVAPAATPTGLAYSNTNSVSPVHYNPTGMPAAISHPATGAYAVTYYGLSSVPVNGGAVLVTTDSSAARCVTPSWTVGTPAFAFVVHIACYDIAGNPMDTGFELLVLPPMGYAYVEVYDGTTAAINQGTSVNPGAAPITVSHRGTGSYVVTFPNSGIDTGWVAHTWAAFGSGQWCETVAWATSRVQVSCHTPAGAPADSAFEILAISSTNGESMAFAFGGNSGTASYSPDPLYSYNPSGAILITRSSAGSYQVVFQGLNGDGGTVQVAPYGSTTNDCYVHNWSTPDFAANVNCVDLHGNPADTQFVTTVISAGATPPDVSYLWADQPTSSNYTESGGYWYRPAGSTSIQRLGAGNYVYGGESIAAPTGYSGPATRCSTLANFGEIQCYDLSGAPTDTLYDLLMMEPIPNIAAVVAFGGSSESVVVTTDFPALMVHAFDIGSGGAISVPVVFAAPASGPSGTFAGGASTVVVVTDSIGDVNLPTFTANNMPGTFTIQAYPAAYDGGIPLQFTLTNLPLTSVTLQTSPAGLPVSLGGASYDAAPQSASLIGGHSETIAAQSPAAGAAGTQYVWLSWSDGGAISHNITVPSSDTAYTATYKTQYQLTASVAPAGEGSASTAGNATYFDSGATAGVTATPAAGYRFVNWIGNVANAQNASTTVNMTAPTTVTAYFAASCNVLGGTSVTAADVAKILGQALGGPAQPDMNSDGVVNVVDVQIVLNAAIGLSCQSK